MKKYMTYEEPLQGRIFTEKQMYEVYRDMADKKEYPDFEFLQEVLAKITWYHSIYFISKIMKL